MKINGKEILKKKPKTLLRMDETIFMGGKKATKNGWTDCGTTLS